MRRVLLSTGDGVCLCHSQAYFAPQQPLVHFLERGHLARSPGPLMLHLGSLGQRQGSAGLPGLASDARRSPGDSTNRPGRLEEGCTARRLSSGGWSAGLFSVGPLEPPRLGLVLTWFATTSFWLRR